DATVVGMQRIAIGVEDDGAGVRMRRCTVGTVANHALPLVAWQLCCIAAKYIRVKGSAAIDVGKRAILSVACDEDHVRVRGMGQDRAMYGALSARENLRRRYTHRYPAAAL